MNESLFSKYVLRFFPKLQRLVDKINGKRKTLTYLHKGEGAMLRQEFSVDNKWESASVNSNYMAADFVALDSPLPVKSRSTLASANGKLPKIGMSKILKESDITNLNVMIAQGSNEQEIARKLANDATACSIGIDERNEYNFLYALSNGVVGIQDDDNPDQLLRLNFNYLDENTISSATAGEISLTDVKNLIDKADADGNTLLYLCIAKSTFDKLRQTREAKELVASYKGQAYTDATSLPVPTASVFQDAFADDNNGIRFKVIDRSVKLEINGKQKSVKPFNASRVIGICNEVVGSLVYGKLAEQSNPVKYVNYTTVDNYKLISSYSLVNPLREVTSGQSICAPIIEDVDQIYILDIGQPLPKSAATRTTKTA